MESGLFHCSHGKFWFSGSFTSDVDLVFVVSNIRKYPDIQKDFQKLLQRFKANLPGLEIDCRLRPEGKSSQLVWDIEDYKKYFYYPG